MKNRRRLQLFGLLFITTILQAYRSEDCGPLEPGRFYLMPKIGDASAIVTHREHNLQVVPKAGVSCPLAGTVSCVDVLTSPQNIFQQDCCPVFKFGEAFSNGVLHVGGEVGYITGPHCLYFIDLIYNRARGNCIPTRTYNFIQAMDGCCENECNDCSDPLVSSQAGYAFGNYTAFGAYVGNRHYFNRIWCDRLSVFLGLKVGILHRQKVCVTGTIPAITNNGVTIFNESTFKAVPLCKTNSISGGVQIGIDYCINDCLSFLVDFEVVASGPARVNRNIPFAIPTPALAGVDALAFPFPTNLSAGPSGVLLQFPIWAGLRWEWDWRCNNACK